MDPLSGISMNTGYPAATGEKKIEEKLPVDPKDGFRTGEPPQQMQSLSAANLGTLNKALFSEGIKNWKCTQPDGFFTSPALSPDGKHLYSGGRDQLHCVNEKGGVDWSKPMEGGNITCTISDKQGNLYVMHHKHLSSYDADGNFRWSNKLGTMFNSGMTFGVDGSVLYCDKDSSKLVSLNPDTGNEKWHKNLDYSSTSTPAVDKDGNIAVIDNEGKIYSFDKDGNEHWRKKPIRSGARQVFAGLGIGNDGTIYEPDNSSKVFTFDVKTGKPGKTIDLPEFSYLNSDPVRGVDGSLYLVCKNAPTTIKALNPDGSKKWDFTMPGICEYSVAVDNEGTVYAPIKSNTGNWLYAIDSAGNEQWKEKFDYEIIASPVVADDGSIYVATQKNTLHALNSKKKRLENFREEIAKAEANPDQSAPGTIEADQKTIDIDGAILKKRKKRSFYMPGLVK